MNPRARYLAVGAALLALLAVGCDGKNLGTLLRKKGCGEPGAPTCPEPPPPPPPPPPTCDDTTEITCGVGACTNRTPRCVDGQRATCLPKAPSLEVCNDIDDNCDGQIDEGCDDDKDGYCDIEMAVIDTPKICTKGKFDCDDRRPERNPGRVELCEDGLDNNCNDLPDYLDINGCTLVTATIQDGDGAISIEHGKTRTVRADLAPPQDGLSREWRVTRALPDASCSVDDVTITEPRETSQSSFRLIEIEDQPVKLGCSYELTFYIEGVRADSIALSMRNPRPRVDRVLGAVLDGELLIMRAASGSRPNLRAVTPEDPDTPVVIEWAGQHAHLLDCGSPCVGAEPRFAAPVAAGTYNFRILSRDSFDGRNRTRNLRVLVGDCVWVNPLGTGQGTSPSPDQAMDSITNAVRAAGMQNANVCISESGTFAIGALVLPQNVGIFAGFNVNGMPSEALATLVFNPGAQLRFEAGYSGALQRLRIQGGNGALVDVVDASPSFYGVDLRVPATDGRALRVQTSDIQDAQVRFVSSQINSSGVVNDATGIELLAQGEGTPSLTFNGSSQISIRNCRGLCRGVAIGAGATGTLTGERIDVQGTLAGTRAIAIEVSGAAQRRASAEIRNMTQLLGRTTLANPADQTIAISLANTQSVRIVNNLAIGPTFQHAGTRLSAAIADGAVDRNAQLTAGGSIDLLIDNNRQLNAGRANYAWDDASCPADLSQLEGTDISAGILLVGTSSATVRNNGRNASRDTAIFGGASSAVWEPVQRLIPPSVPAIWTIDTRDVQVLDNEIRPGVLFAPPGCLPQQLPHTTAVRDGLAPFVEPALSSQRLRLARNGIVTGRRVQFDVVPNIDRVGARLIELSGPNPGAPTHLENNYLAVTRGSDLVGLYAHRTAAVSLWNNVIELETITSSGAVQKRGLVLRDGAALTMVNNIVVVRQLDASAPAALELDPAQLGVELLQLDHNLLFVEALERGLPGAYVRVVGGQSYDRAGFTEFAGQVGATNNLLLPPLLKPFDVEYRRSLTRLSSQSPARDAGLLKGSPAEDHFSNPRPLGLGVDIGHHEFAP